jgi:hypothetical protein
MTAGDGGLPWWRRAAMPLVMAVSLLLVTGYCVVVTPQLAVLRQGANRFLLGAGRQPASGATRRLAAAVPAVAAEPLGQQVASGVIAARAQTSGDTARALREAALLRELGWRSTSALQNLLWRGGTIRDLPLIMDTLDALLRRQKLLGNIYPVLNLMTVDPAFRTLLTRRLEGRPSWRLYYFQSAGDLRKPDEIDGRYQVMRTLQRRGDRLTRNEIAPILPRLLAAGQGAAAFDLWQAHAGRLAGPLTDPDFAVAARPLPGDALPVPFEWQLGNGNGYYADVSSEGGVNLLGIDWSGRGTPTFVSQVTSARPGRYRLFVSGEAGQAGTAGLLDRLGFRLVCPGRKPVEFAPVAGGSGRGAPLRLDTVGAVACAFPTLEFYGLVQSGMAPGAMVLRRIQMTRIGA